MSRNPQHTRHYDRTLNGVRVNVWARPKSCFFCDHCTSMIVDLDGRPYVWVCEMENDIDKGMYEKCEDFIEETNDGENNGE